MAKTKKNVKSNSSIFDKCKAMYHHGRDWIIVPGNKPKQIILKPKTQRLLDQLVEEAGIPGLPPEDRIFDKKWAYIYIYNLLNGDYQYSGNEYKELFLYLTVNNFPDKSKNKTSVFKKLLYLLYKKK